jgi:vitamin B12/bleomycin/antimicrobial peptide transport system ATP-binding/permease protein
MSSKSRLLWNRFVTIAQPYFYPTTRGGGWITFLLLTLLLVFVFALLFAIVTAITLACHQFIPALTEKAAPGLNALLLNILKPPSLYIYLALLIVPAIAFWLFGKPLKNRWQQWALLGLVLLLSVSVTGINVGFSYIGNFFTNALVKKNQDSAYLFVGVYFIGFLIAIPIIAFYGYVQDYLGLRWREWLTNDLVGRYFQRRAYYGIESERVIDNPDQRISEDARSFTGTTLTFLLIILGAVMDLVSFSGILWAKSTLLVTVVLAYSIIGTIVTALIGRRLIKLNFNQRKYEADYRYGLVHVRDNAESIAFYRGEEQESQQLSKRFVNALKNYNILIGWQRNLGFFTSAYRYIPVVLPYLVLFPQYFGNKIEYGDMVQANFAFSQVNAALSIIVNQFENIAGFAAGIDRLSDFREKIDAHEQDTDTTGSKIGLQESSQVNLNHVTLTPPDASRVLVKDLSLALNPTESLVIVGPSGVGKSSLLRAIAGIWQTGEGSISRPNLEEMMFLPQRPYMILGSLRSQLLYPNVHHIVSDAELLQQLEQVNLADLPERVGGLDAELDWADMLSLGEQQRLAFARLFLGHPHYAVLDEATSALDIRNEEALYQRLKDSGVTYISVGHRPSLVKYHQQVLELQGESQWRLVPAATYMAEAT